MLPWMLESFLVWFDGWCLNTCSYLKMKLQEPNWNLYADGGALSKDEIPCSWQGKLQAKWIRGLPISVSIGLPFELVISQRKITQISSLVIEMWPPEHRKYDDEKVWGTTNHYVDFSFAIVAAVLLLSSVCKTGFIPCVSRGSTPVVFCSGEWGATVRLCEAGKVI